MYREETEYSSNFYEYIGMANVENKITRETVCLVKEWRDKAEAFRVKSLEDYPNGYELQMLEQAVIALMPYSDKYRTTKEHELFVAHYALSGIHYFKEL